LIGGDRGDRGLRDRSPDKFCGNQRLGTEDREDYFAHPGRQQPAGYPYTPNPNQLQPGLTSAHQAGNPDQAQRAVGAERD